MQADSFGQRSRTFPRSGGNDKSYGDSVKFSSIRKVVQEVGLFIAQMTETFEYTVYLSKFKV